MTRNPSQPGAIKRVRLGAGHRLSIWSRHLSRNEHPELYTDYTAQDLASRPFINIGAGKFAHPHWQNVDYKSDWYEGAQTEQFVHHDLTALEPLPFADGSIALVYTSHTIEHVPDAAVRHLFAESHRVLRPGGAIRVTCPDAALYYRTLALAKRSYWSWRHPWFSGPLSTASSLDDVTIWDFFVREVATPRCRHFADALDPLDPPQIEEMFRTLKHEEFLDGICAELRFNPAHPGNHINWWDEDKLMPSLADAGFRSVYRSRRGQSLFPPMTDASRFDATKPVNSLYVEAVRGG